MKGLDVWRVIVWRLRSRAPVSLFISSESRPAWIHFLSFLRDAIQQTGNNMSLFSPSVILLPLICLSSRFVFSYLSAFPSFLLHLHIPTTTHYTDLSISQQLLYSRLFASSSFDGRFWTRWKCAALKWRAVVLRDPTAALLMCWDFSFFNYYFCLKWLYRQHQRSWSPGEIARSSPEPLRPLLCFSLIYSIIKVLNQSLFSHALYIQSGSDGFLF